MIEASLRPLPPDPRWLDFAGFVAPLANAGEDSVTESRVAEPAGSDAAEALRSRGLVGSDAGR